MGTKLVFQLGEKLTFANGDQQPFTVLVAPLDWGLGHASRCVPVIHECLNAGCEVIIASSGHQKALLQAEFPQLSFLDLPGYSLHFAKTKPLTIVKIITQVPKILIKIKRENRWLSQLIKHKHLDMVISDNRFGMYHASLRSVFITHQLLIKTPFGGRVDRLLQKINYHFIRRFNRCWVPDAAADNNLAGKLSHPTVLPNRKTIYLGALSRIKARPLPPQQQLLVLLSGPEPQRTLLEERLLLQLPVQQLPVILVRGLPDQTTIKSISPGKVTTLNHAATATMEKLINESAIIISRPGYSTVMDLLPLGKKCIFLPTPGQTEQEYLAEYLHSKGWCCTASQENFDLSRLLEEASNLTLPDLSALVNGNLLREALRELLSKLP